MKYSAAEDIVSNVVRQLKELRLKKGFSHETLAQRTGVSRPAISHIESGKRKPSLFLILKLAHALDVELSSLMRKCEKL